ncbi:MAG: cytochrome c3 family protein [Thermodesulfovibrionales bacterium]
MPYRKIAKSKELRAKSKEQGARVFYILLFALCYMLFASVVDARVKGKCKDCHSMHYSYEGKEVTYGDRQGPFPALTQGGCIGCHGRNPNGTKSIITTGKTRIPQILHHLQNDDLAGGNFYYVADEYNPDYSKGHNIKGISRQENPPMDVPPGFMKNVLIPGGTGPAYWPGQQQLTCAGTWGCHGNRTIENLYQSLYGAHHSDDRIIDGSTVGKSYRFLYGIKGTEHRDWEYLATINNHNGYKGDIAHDTMDTISYLCGECHAKFHPNPNLGGSREVGQAYNSIWRRHPADIAFATVHGGFASSEYQGYVTYSLEAPVAFGQPTGGEEVVDSNSILMCLSCHRSHASQYSDILRWDYSKMDTRNVTKKGCLACHTKKNQ